MNSGKVEDIDLDQFTTMNYVEERYRTITRNENGVINSIDKWVMGSEMKYFPFAIADGLDFVFAPLSEDEYALIFEILDTQGNSYCSEPIELNTSNYSWREEEKPSVTTVESDGTFPLLLKEDESFAVYLIENEEYGSIGLSLKAVNKSDSKLYYSTANCIYNGTIQTGSKYGPYGNLNAGDTENSLVNFSSELIEEIGAFSNIASLQFDISLSNYNTRKTLWNNETIVVRFKNGCEYTFGRNSDTKSKTILEKNCNTLFGGIVKNHQKLIDNQTLLVELMCFGMDGNELKGVCHIENRSDKTLSVSTECLAIDDICVNINSSVEILPKMETYCCCELFEDTLSTVGIDSLTKLQLCFVICSGQFRIMSKSGETVWVDIELEKTDSKKSKLPEGSTVLMDENGIVIKYLSLLKPDPESTMEKRLFTVENNTDDGVTVELSDRTVEDVSETDNTILYCESQRLGPHQSTVVAMNAYTDMVVEDGIIVSKENYHDGGLRISTKFNIFSFTKDKFLFTGNNTIHIVTGKEGVTVS